MISRQDIKDFKSVEEPPGEKEDDVVVKSDIEVDSEMENEVGIEGSINYEEIAIGISDGSFVSQDTPDPILSDTEIQNNEIMELENGKMANALYPDVFLEVGGSESPLSEIAQNDENGKAEAEKEKRLVRKRWCIFCCVISCFGCVCCLFCICILIIALIVAGSLISSFYFECVTGNEENEVRFDLSGTKILIMDHFGGLDIKTGSGNDIYMNIKSYGKKALQPNYEVKTFENNITTLTQHHIDDDEVMNELFSSIICEGINIQIIMPENYPLEIISTTRLLTEKMKIRGPQNLHNLQIEIPEGGKSVMIDDVYIFGNLSFKATKTEESTFSNIDVTHSSYFDIDDGILRISEIEIGFDLYITHKTNDLHLSNIEVGATTDIDRSDGDFHLSNVDGNIFNLQMSKGNLYFNDFEFNSIGIKESDDNEIMKFSNGVCKNDFILETDNSKVDIDGLRSEWGTLSLNLKFEEVSIKNVQEMSLDCESEYTEYTINLDENYFGDSKVLLDLQTLHFGDVELEDPNDYVSLSTEEDDEILGWINEDGGESHEFEYYLKIVSSYDHINIAFS